jgi:outer membrane biogenesis lipoprotein LolB
MNRFALPFLLLLLFVMFGCTDKAPKSSTKEDAKEQFAQTYDIERFKLFPTQNM